MAVQQRIWTHNLLDIVTTSIKLKENVQTAALRHNVNLSSLTYLYSLLSKQRKKEREVCFPPSSLFWKGLTPLVLTRLELIGQEELISRIVTQAS
jgi:hypothetical protein